MFLVFSAKGNVFFKAFVLPNIHPACPAKNDAIFEQQHMTGNNLEKQTR
jgi:hypothetical protein